MFKYFTNQPCEYKLSDTAKTPVSLRLDIGIVDKADMMAIQEDRSRNFIINRLLSDIIHKFEKRNGTIEVDAEVLRQIRKKRGM
jgi:predicted transcriptional regulator